jgi:hypothetical protein
MPSESDSLSMIRGLGFESGPPYVRLGVWDFGCTSAKRGPLSTSKMQFANLLKCWEAILFQ